MKHIGQPAHHAVTGIDLTRDLGFATFRLGYGHVRLAIRREQLSHACVRQLTELLIEYEPRRIVIEQGPARPPEILNNVNDTVARLDELRGRNPGERMRPPFSFESLGLERLRHPKRRHLLRYFMKWKRAQGEMSAREFASLQKNPFTDRTLVTRLNQPDRPIIETWPRSIKLFKPCEVISLIGQAVEDQPDRAYGAATAVGYVMVNRDQRPRLELVETTMMLPDGGTRWARYERLLLPWRAGTSDRLVASQSLPRAVRFQSAGD
ncbi:MAG TPA: hypothetical protein VM689_26715 [Aliidongia sp.]|nr:hypothetical protein [Aliidongia sp.]